MTSTAVASIATLMLFSTVAALAMTEPLRHESRDLQPLNQSTIAERLAPESVPDSVPETIVVSAPSTFSREQKMSCAELMKRWEPLIKTASRQFEVPADWIREVIRLESGGRTMLGDNMQMVSSRGALGLMQLLPATYSEMRSQYGLGKDPFNPRDNIFAGAAYLKWLRGKYGYPAMFAAYNEGPGNYEQRTAKGELSPTETQNYLAAATFVLGGNKPAISNPLAALVPTGTTAISVAALVTPPPALDTAPAPVDIPTAVAGAAPSPDATPAGPAGPTASSQGAADLH